MGLECDVTAFETAWVNGIFRLAGQNRPTRKQSSVLTVSALQFLEAELDNENLALVDRYAIGVVLFATYSRARFGDLRKISSVILDEANSTSTDCLGYIEMNSASHKMRAFGNRLGAQVPLVASIKGLGKTAWGKTFISIATKVGLTGQGEPRLLERSTSGLCNCWWGAASTPVASLHMGARRQHSQCLQSMVQIWKRG